MMYCRKYDYASWDKYGNPFVISRNFKFKDIEIAINEDYIYVGICKSKSILNNVMKIHYGEFYIDDKEDRLKIVIIPESTDKLTSGIHVCIDYIPYFNSSYYWNTNENEEYYVMSKWVYDKKGKYIGITRNDIDEFYNVMKYKSYMKFDFFKDIVKESEPK